MMSFLAAIIRPLVLSGAVIHGRLLCLLCHCWQHYTAVLMALGILAHHGDFMRDLGCLFTIDTITTSYSGHYWLKTRSTDKSTGMLFVPTQGDWEGQVRYMYTSSTQRVVGVLHSA